MADIWLLAAEDSAGDWGDLGLDSKWPSENLRPLLASMDADVWSWF